jgi:glycosyltransferase involved in cell wall biosynthesis
MNHVKVAHVSTVDLVLRMILNQLRSIRSAGYEVVGISVSGSQVAGLESAGIRHVSVPMKRDLSPLRDLSSLWHLYWAIRRENFTIVHTHTPKAGLLGQMAARMAGVPIVVNTVHGFYFHEHMHPNARRFYITMEKIAARCSNLILSQNAEDIQTAICEHICPPQKLRFLGNGIDLQCFDPERVAATDESRCRQELGIAPDAPVVGFVGRLAGRRKGFLDFLAASRLIATKRPDVRFLIAGDTDHGKPDAVEPSAAADYGIADRCVFLGYRTNEELPLFYKLMNVLVLPSLFEGVPRVVMEASAMGTPSVATDVKGNREAVEHNRNGLLVRFGDVQALAAAVLRILSEPAMARRMSNEARRIAIERFDERVVCAKIKSEYARLLNEMGQGLDAPCTTETVHLYPEKADPTDAD